MIVAHELTNAGNDRTQLSNMAMANPAPEEIGAELLKVVADRGYYKGLETLACERLLWVERCSRPNACDPERSSLANRSDKLRRR